RRSKWHWVTGVCSSDLTPARRIGEAIGEDDRVATELVGNITDRDGVESGARGKIVGVCFLRCAARKNELRARDRRLIGVPVRRGRPICVAAAAIPSEYRQARGERHVAARLRLVVDRET